MASNRAPVLAELPRAGAPPAFASYAEWEAWVERLVRLGVTQDYTRIWWDVRPHPKFGTLEVRVPDQPTDVRLSAAFAALLQALCATALAGGYRAPGLGDRGRADYAQNRWAAARFGPAAELLHPGRTRGRDGGGARRRAARARRGRLAAGRHRGVARIDPTGARPTLQSRSASPRKRRRISSRTLD